jgi:Tfp pilus assembly protein PilF
MTSTLRNTVLSTLLVLGPVCKLCLGQTRQSNQDEITVHSRLAEQYLQERRPESAIPESRKVVSLDPKDVDAGANLGVLLFFQHDYADAVPQLRAALRLEPDLWKLQALLGLGEAKLGDSMASRSDLESAFPHLRDEKIQRQVGETLINEYTAEEELGKAATVVSTLLAAHPTDASLLYLSYRLYSDLANRSMLTLALAAPESAQIHEVMARELARQNNNTAAIANYRSALSLDPDVSDLHTELGDLLFHSDDLNLQAQAVAQLKTALALNPKDERAEIELGMAESRQGNLKAAYANYSRALELNPDSGEACMELGKILITMNQPQKAQQMFERAVRIDPTNDIAHYRLATLYRKQGKLVEAKEEVALYLKYKGMRDKMEKIFHDMRVLAPPRSDDDQAKNAQ